MSTCNSCARKDIPLLEEDGQQRNRPLESRLWQSQNPWES